MTIDDIESVRIMRRETHYDRKVYHADARQFSEVFIMASGQSFYTRLFHTLDDTPHARAAQVQNFLRRQVMR